MTAEIVNLSEYRRNKVEEMMEKTVQEILIDYFCTQCQPFILEIKLPGEIKEFLIETKVPEDV